MQVGFPSTVHKLSSVHAFRGDEQFFPGLELVGVPEVHNGQWGAATWVVDDILNDTLNVAMTFGEVQITEFWRSLPFLGVGFEDGSRTFTLCTNYTSHVLTGMYRLVSNLTLNTHCL